MNKNKINAFKFFLLITKGYLKEQDTLHVTNTIFKQVLDGDIHIDYLVGVGYYSYWPCYMRLFF